MKIALSKYLAENWKDWHRRWSVRLGIVASVLTTLLIASPDALQVAWTSLPVELRDSIPQKYVPLIGVGLFVLSLLAQLLKQAKLHAQRELDLQARREDKTDA